MNILYIHCIVYHHYLPCGSVPFTPLPFHSSASSLPALALSQTETFPLPHSAALSWENASHPVLVIRRRRAFVPGPAQILLQSPFLLPPFFLLYVWPIFRWSHIVQLNLMRTVEFTGFLNSLLSSVCWDFWMALENELLCAKILFLLALIKNNVIWWRWGQCIVLFSNRLNITHFVC